MKEVTVAALDSGLQKQAESARSAFERGQWDRVVTLCAGVLEVAPGCLPVRKLQRAAKLKQGAPRALGRLWGALAIAPALLAGKLALAQDPLKALVNAQKALAVAPMSISALRLLGAAATALGWSETAVHAHEAVREIEPENLPNLVALGRACLGAGRADSAMQLADAVLRRDEANAEAQALLRDASVALTLRQGRWEDGGDFRAKLRQPS